MKSIPDVHGVDRDRFVNEIVPAGLPVVLRGVVGDWPAVQAARQSPRAAADYLKVMDVTKKAVSVSVLQPEHQGRFFYDEDVSGYNFFVDQRNVSGVVDWLADNAGRSDVVTVYIQALILSVFMPAFERDNPLPMLEKSYGGRMWIGNGVRTQTHFDPSHNLACVVAGQRRFTLFPPEQIDNLYPGPFDTAPGHVPVSMASLEAPDFDRHPRFREALETAQAADLLPGDALYIPYGWWHHVQSGPGLNAMVNYWWTEEGADWVSPFLAVYASILSMRDLAPEQKQIWKHIMDRYVFGDTQASVAHLPQGGQGVFGKLTMDVRKRVGTIVKRLAGDIKP